MTLTVTGQARPAADGPRSRGPSPRSQQARSPLVPDPPAPLKGRTALAAAGTLEQRDRKRRTHERPAPPPIVVELRGDVAADLVEYARKKISHVLTHTGQPVLNARARVARHGDPARERPVVAQANVDVNGRFVRVQIEAATAREALDLLADRLERTARGWEARRGRVFEAEPHEWRHDFPATPRRSYYPRPPAERRVVRHKTIACASSWASRDTTNATAPTLPASPYPMAVAPDASPGSTVDARRALSTPTPTRC
jgi:ribosome-associated translation inhibitor RaiA